MGRSLGSCTEAGFIHNREVPEHNLSPDPGGGASPSTSLSRRTRIDYPTATPFRRKAELLSTRSCLRRRLWFTLQAATAAPRSCSVAWVAGFSPGEDLHNIAIAQSSRTLGAGVEWPFAGLVYPEPNLDPTFHSLEPEAPSRIYIQSDCGSAPTQHYVFPPASQLGRRPDCPGPVSSAPGKPQVLPPGLWQKRHVSSTVVGPGDRVVTPIMTTSIVTRWGWRPRPTAFALESSRRAPGETVCPQA